MGLLTSVGPDGIANSGYAWTNQSTSFNSNKTLESGGPASSSTLNPALRRTYSAMSMDPYLAASTAFSVASPTIATAIYVPQNFVCSSADYIFVATAGNVTIALWPSTAPAGTAVPIVWSAATATGSAGVTSLTWNGTGSPTSVTLVGGTTYLATIISSAASTVAGLTLPANVANAAPSGVFSTSTTYFNATVGTLTGAITSASVFGTSTLSNNVPWIALH